MNLMDIIAKAEESGFNTGAISQKHNISPTRQQELDNLLKIGHDLQIDDPETLLDIDVFLKQRIPNKGMKRTA